MISIRLNGKEYTDFTNGSVSLSMENLVGSFNLIATANEYSSIPIKLNDYVQIITDGVQLMCGFIEIFSISYGIDSHIITISGRGVLADIIDSTLPESKVFSGSNTLKGIAGLILKDLGYKTNNIINNAGTIKKFDAVDIEEAENSSTIFEFLETMAKKRQVLLNTDSVGNLIFTKGNTGNAPTSLINILNSDENNVLSSEYSLDNSERFHTYVVKSSLNPTNNEVEESAEVIVNQSGKVTGVDDEVRSTRRTEIVVNGNINSNFCFKRAEWEYNIRRANSIIYTCTIQGHSFNGIIWRPNKIVQIRDDFCNLHVNMLIKSVTFEYSLEQGSTTTIECVPKDSYTLKTKIESSEKSTAKSGRTIDEVLADIALFKEQQAKKKPAPEAESTGG